LQDYLPPGVHEAFLTTLTQFVLLPWREAMRSSLTGASQGGSQARRFSAVCKVCHCSRSITILPLHAASRPSAEGPLRTAPQP